MKKVQGFFLVGSFNALHAQSGTAINTDMTLPKAKWMAIVVTLNMLVAALVCHGQTAKPQAGEKAGVENPKPKPQAEVKEEIMVPKAGTPRILGWKEWVWVVKPEIVLRAKLDTGARTCSIHAANIETLEIDGKKWVKFTICDPEDENGAHHRHKAPVVRVAKVKNDAGGLDTRYVVPLTFEIGGQKLETEFNLNDRSHLVCEVLIGRNALKELGAVDSSRTDLLGKPRSSEKKHKKPAPAGK